MPRLASRIALLIPPTWLGPRLVDLLPLVFACVDLDVLPEDCNTEQEAARILGYTRVSWNNRSGKEQQPASAEKDWDALAHKEKLAAIVLGYTRKMWDKGKKQPPAADKRWAELSTCGDVHS